MDVEWLPVLAQAVDLQEAGDHAHNFEIGPGAAAMIIAIVTAILTTITVIVNAILAARSRTDTKERLAEVREIGNQANATTKEVHNIVNSQRSEMVADAKIMAEQAKSTATEIQGLKDQVRELLEQRARDAQQKADTAEAAQKKTKEQD